MIKISKMADYAVVILADMMDDPDRISSAAALSASTALPEPTVSKILKILTNASIITSVRGAGGGYKLGRAPESIKVLEVITSVDGPVALVNCVEPDDPGCRLSGTCCLAGRWDGVNAAVREVLERVSLVDMLGKPPCGAPVEGKG